MSAPVSDDVRCCAHARRRMKRARLSTDDVLSVVQQPAWRRHSYAGRVEHYGYVADGRHVRVVVESDERTVVTVVVEPFRR